MLERLEEVVFDFDNILRNYHKYSDREIYFFINEIEKVVDQVISRNRPTKPTDFKFKMFNDALAEYEKVIKSLRDAIINKDYVRARTVLQEVVTVVRRMTRLLSFIASETYLPTAEGAKEIEQFIGAGVSAIAENLEEFEERVKDLSYLARSILAVLYSTPTQELNLKELPLRLGITNKKMISDAIEELKRKLPDVIDVVPDLNYGGLKIKMKKVG